MWKDINFIDKSLAVNNGWSEVDIRDTEVTKTFVSSTEPANALVGDFWFNSVTKELYVFTE